MSSQNPVPYFPSPPNEYNKSYMAQVVRAFAVFAQQVNNPGPLQGTTLAITALPVYANNADALTGGLSVNDVYRTATGELRIVI